MKALLRNYLKLECDKNIHRFNEYLYNLEQEISRKNKRLGTTIGKEIKYPQHWKLHQHFNPFKCHTSKKLDLYSYTLAKAIIDKNYSPACSVVQNIPKESGGFREVNIFPLPDSAVSLMVYKSLLHKNVNRFSSYSYAYREDRGAHDSIFDISTEWRNLGRVFVAEFDFSKFFDNISHDYLWQVFKRQRILCTEEERFVVQQFLTSKCSDTSNYDPDGGKAREKGIPQGTSVSLFLANLACMEMDRELSRIGVGFSRYADDTIVWSNDYARIVQSYEVIAEFGKRMGVPINLDKSQGISLITSGLIGEIRTKQSVDYLGYKIGLDSVSISDKSISKIKTKLAYLIYENLLQPLKKGIFNNNRLNQIDWDYIVALSQIRRYMYGGLSDEKLNLYLKGAVQRLNFRGVMSYYPVVDNKVQLAKLDGWLRYTLKQSMKVRSAMWLRHSNTILPGPSVDWINKIDSLTYWTTANKNVYDLRIPSFQLIHRAMQKGIINSGLEAVTSLSNSYY